MAMVQMAMMQTVAKKVEQPCLLHIFHYHPNFQLYKSQLLRTLAERAPLRMLFHLQP
jgi:hypothetical protein